MKRTLAIALLFTLAQDVHAQRTTLVLRDGMNVPGVGALTSISTLAGVDDQGRWLAWVDTDHSDNARDGVLLRGSGVVVREGDAMSLPTGSTLNAADGWSVTGNGSFFATVSLDGTTNSSDDEALYFGSQLILREGEFLSAPEFSTGTFWKQLFECWSVGADSVLVAANLDDPMLPTSTDRALVRLNLDGTGSVLSASAVAAEGSQFSGLPVIADVGVSPQTAAINAQGQALFQARFAGVDAASDGALLLRTNLLGTTLLAREGSPSPVAGRAWEVLLDRPVDLNGSEAWVLRANLDGDQGDDEVIVLGSSAGPRIVAREGDAFSAFGGNLLESFGLNSPVFVGSDNSVLWYADWSDPDETRDSGLVFTQLDHPNPAFVHQVLIQEGVTQIDGLLVDSIAPEPGGYALSRSGRFVLCEVRFVGGIDGLVLIDRLGPHLSFCEGDVAMGALCEACPCGNEGVAGIASGCRHSGGTGAELMATGNSSLSSDTLRFEVRAGIPTSYALLVSGSDRLPTNPLHPCFGLGTGINPGNLDGLLCVGGSRVFRGVRGSDSAGDVGLANPGFGPPDRPLQGFGAQGGFVAGQTCHYQVWMRDSPLGGCQTGIATTNGRTVLWLP